MVPHSSSYGKMSRILFGFVQIGRPLETHYLTNLEESSSIGLSCHKRCQSRAQGWLLGNAGINSEAAHGRCTSSTTPAAGRMCLSGSSRKLEAGCAVPSPLLGMALQTRPGS